LVVVPILRGMFLRCGGQLLGSAATLAVVAPKVCQQRQPCKTEGQANESCNLREVLVAVINLSARIERAEAFRQRSKGILGSKVSWHFFDAVDGAKLAISARDSLRMLEDEGVIDRHNLGTLTWGKVGVAMSHRALWQQCVKQGHPEVILEDDVHLVPGFEAELKTLLEQALENDADIVYFGYNYDGGTDLLFGSPKMACSLVWKHADLDWSSTRRRGQGSQGSQASPVEESGIVRVGDPVTVDWGLPTTGPWRRLFARTYKCWGLCGYVVTPAGAQKLLTGCFPLKGNIDGHMIDLMRSGEVCAYAVVPPLAAVENDINNCSDTQGREGAGCTVRNAFLSGGL